MRWSSGNFRNDETPRQLERYDEPDEISRSLEKSMSAALPGPVLAPPLAGRAAAPVR